MYTWTSNTIYRSIIGINKTPSWLSSLLLQENRICRDGSWINNERSPGISLCCLRKKNNALSALATFLPKKQSPRHEHVIPEQQCVKSTWSCVGQAFVLICAPLHENNNVLSRLGLFFNLNLVWASTQILYIGPIRGDLLVGVSNAKNVA